jgi:group I intron endonuclease
MIMHTIYKLTFERGVYIGSTGASVAKRVAHHRCEAKRGSQRPIHCAIREGEFSVEVLDSTDDADLALLLEMTYIQEFDSIANGYNLSIGKGSTGYRSKQAIEKSAAAHRGMKRSAETRAKISAGLRGNKIWIGKHHTEETRAKMSASRLCYLADNRDLRRKGKNL